MTSYTKAIEEIVEKALKGAMAYGFDKGYQLPPDFKPDHDKANAIRDTATTQLEELIRQARVEELEDAIDGVKLPDLEYTDYIKARLHHLRRRSSATALAKKLVAT